MITPNTAEAIAFLIGYRGSDPIVLTADVILIQSKTFRPAAEQERLRDWLYMHQGVKNLYCTLTPILGAIWGQQKAREEFIRGVTTLRVDIDHALLTPCTTSGACPCRATCVRSAYLYHAPAGHGQRPGTAEDRERLRSNAHGSSRRLT